MSKATFIPLYCAILYPHLEYAMEANTPTLISNFIHLEIVLRFATRLVRGHVPYEERFRKLNLF